MSTEKFLSIIVFIFLIFVFILSLNVKIPENDFIIPSRTRNPYQFRRNNPVLITNSNIRVLSNNRAVDISALPQANQVLPVMENVTNAVETRIIPDLENNITNTISNFIPADNISDFISANMPNCLSSFVPLITNNLSSVTSNILSPIRINNNLTPVRNNNLSPVRNNDLTPVRNNDLTPRTRLERRRLFRENLQINTNTLSPRDTTHFRENVQINTNTLTPRDRSQFRSESEMVVCNVLEDLLKDRVQINIREDFLKNPKTGRNLELDCYYEKKINGKLIKIGVEYQGGQHYYYVPRFHKNGQNDLEYSKEKDKIKKELCAKNGIILICIPFIVDSGEKKSDGTWKYVNHDLETKKQRIKTFLEPIIYDIFNS